MKKLLLIGVGFVLAIAIFSIAGYAYAQRIYPEILHSQIDTEIDWADSPEFPYDHNGERGVYREAIVEDIFPHYGGMLDFDVDGEENGILRDYLWSALAEAFNMTDDQIEAFEIVRETILGIRQGFSQEEIQDIIKQAMVIAVENAQTDGAITAEQAERWLEHIDQMERIAPGMPFYGRGRFGRYRQGFVKGVQFGRQVALNQEYLDAAIADVLEISVHDLQEIKIEQGFNLKAYADEQGLNDTELAALRVEIFSNAINLALQDGAISQQQADWLMERLENIESRESWLDQP
jgi:hypothetical protein